METISSIVLPVIYLHRSIVYHSKANTVSAKIELETNIYQALSEYYYYVL